MQSLYEELRGIEFFKEHEQFLVTLPIWTRNYATHGFQQRQRLENQENENENGKVMERDKLAKSHGILCHRILPILPPNCTKLVFLVTSKKLSSDLDSLTISAKCGDCKIGKRDGTI